MKKIFIVLSCLLVYIQPVVAQDILNAVRKGDIDEVKMLLKKNPNLINTKDGYQNSLLFIALIREEFKIAELLIMQGIDVKYARSDRGGNELHGAVGTAPLKLVKLMVEKGANINQKNVNGWTPLIAAVLDGKKEIAYFLLNKGARLNIAGLPVERIMRSALLGNMDRITDLLTKNYKIDYLNIDYLGNTFLHTAAKGGMTSFVGPLTDKGADVNKKNIYGWVPLHYAAAAGYNAMIEVLIKKGAIKNIRTNDGRTPYNIAGEYKQTDTIRLLKQKGFDSSAPRFPDLKDKYIDPVLPDHTPRRFAPGIVSKRETFEHGMLTFSSDLNAACWSDWQRTGISRIFLMEKNKGRWQSPEVVLRGGTNPCISSDGQKIFFTAKRTLMDGGKSKDNDIYFIAKKGSRWGEPKNLGPNVNTDKDELQPSVTCDGTVYFSYNADIYRSRNINGKYNPREKLPGIINTKTNQGESFISHDEKFLIFRSLGTGGIRAANVYLSRRTVDDKWTAPINIAQKIKIRGLFPSLTPDGRYLFYFRHDIYWLDFKLAQTLKQ